MDANKKSIKQWAEEERPREKMLHKGAAALTLAELLAILIQNGTRNKSAIDLAQDILESVQYDIQLLGRLTTKEFQKVKGIGHAKAICLQAALELGRRRQLSEGLARPNIRSSADAAGILFPLLKDKPHEMFCVLYLNHSLRLLRHELVSSGGLTATVVDIKMILKNALQLPASVLIVAHNHPSGNLQPSKADQDITQKLRDGAEAVDMRLSDHLIIGQNRYFSFADEGLL